MNLVIFAGGAGTRLWPLSRKATPKQFEPIFEGKSTLQLAVERVSEFGLDNIYISTNQDYVDVIQKRIPELTLDHVFAEPAMRDVAAAVGLSLARLKHMGKTGTVAVLWSDHVMDHPEAFRESLRRANELLKQDPERFIFLGEKPRYANEQLGWINVGKELDLGVKEFEGFKYRPDNETCKKFFASGEWLWNSGYFVFDIDFALAQYEKHMPEMYQALMAMARDEEKIKEEYSNLEKISFDNAILEKLDPSQAVVLSVDLGWSDPGTLYAMKELLAQSEADNVEQGKVITHESEDCFVYNGDDERLVAVLGMKGVVVANTGDSLLVCHKDKMHELKKLLEKIKEEGHEQHL